MHLVLVRHGESTANVAGLWQGHGDAPLSRRGRMQAESLASRLRDAPFDSVVSSDLTRARETAELATGRTPRTVPAFREANVGAWEGLPRAAIAARFPEQLEALMQNRDDVALGGGESLGAFWSRVDAGLDALVAETPKDARVALFSHGGVIAAVLARVLGRRGRPRGDLKLTRFANTGVTVLRHEAGAWRVAGLNCVAHLGRAAVAEEERKGSGGRVVRVDADDAAAPGAVGEPMNDVRATPADAHALVVSLLAAQAAEVEPLEHGAHVHLLRDNRGAKLVDVVSKP